MVYLVDAHTLVWFLADGSKIGPSAVAVLRDPTKRLVIPSIVLCEIKWMIRKKSARISLDEVFEALEEDPRCTIFPLDSQVIRQMPDKLEMHDSIICGTALVYKNLRREEAKVLTQDTKIHASGVVEAVW